MEPPNLVANLPPVAESGNRRSRGSHRSRTLIELSRMRVDSESGKTPAGAMFHHSRALDHGRNLLMPEISRGLPSDLCPERGSRLA
uniref:Uncharacterized protein n=1 Tax=Picea glauca TaxID=3330 RepID=A0A101LU26_PICGL|nr:hypothetical protein ABT39_MTgene3605 [Picea glauca]